MNSSRMRMDSAVGTAMLCAVGVTGQFVAGKAARDALYLANLPVTSLPAMIIATSICSIALAAASSRVLRRVAPATFVPAAFAVSAVLLLVEWALVSVAPLLAARLLYLQISGAGPILGSGFWLIATERFDPRTAKHRFGQIASAGTLGGLAGGLLTERLAAISGLGAILPVLAALNVFCAWQIRRLAAPMDARASARLIEDAPELAPVAPRSGFRVLSGTPYLRNLAAIVTLGTMGAALADYLFRAEAVATLGNGESLLRFFAIYYAAVSLVTFMVQASASRLALEKLGLTVTASTPSVALAGGGLGSLIAPGLESIMAARAGESIFRGSLFRASYEIFYTPIPSEEKRAAKSIIDVGFDRLGDASGGAAVWLMLLLPQARQATAILTLAIVCSIAAVVVARQLNRGYIQTLERSLLHRALELDLSDVADTTTRTTMLRTLSGIHGLRPQDQRALTEVERTVRRATERDEELGKIVALRSRERERIHAVLQGDSIPGGLVSHVIPLLAWDPVAEDAVNALRRVAEEHIGTLTDALIDPNQDFAVRRRLPRVFSVCVSQRAADGLLLGLDDLRFEVRFQCARSLALIKEKNLWMRIDRDRVFDVVRREVEVGRPVWEGHRLLNQLDDGDQRVFVDEFVKDRAGRSLAHVFTLLSLVLPAEPLQIAYRGIHTDDDNLRGTALEYLDGVLPKTIRDRLWPFLEEGPRRTAPAGRGREEILADLLRSHQSIVLNLEEIRRREGTA
jgi:hypothetical protein